MEVLVLDGKSYVKASKAARDLGYATDYVGQLCRSGQVDAHLIGRTWYVNRDELSTHRLEKKRMSRVKAREQAHKSIEEHRNLKAKTKNNYTNIAIQYENDTKALIPEPRKIAVISETHKRHYHEIEDERENNQNVVENEGEVVQMSGDLSVVDVTEGEIDDDTTVLSPRMMRVKPNAEEAPEDEPIIKDSEREILTKKKPKSFMDRLSEYQKEGEVTNEVVIQEKVASLAHVKVVPSVVSCVLCILIFLVVTMCSLFILVKTSYVNESNGTTAKTEIRFATKETIAILKLKI